MHTRIKFKLLIVLLFALLPSFFFIFYLYDLWYDARRAQIFDTNLFADKLITAFLDSSINTAATVAKNLASDPTIINLLEKGKDESPAGDKIQALLDTTNNNIPEIPVIMIINNQGSIVMKSPPLAEEEKSLNFSDRDYFKQALKTRTTAVSYRIVSKITGKPIIGIVHPVLKNGSVIGIVTTSYDAEYLENQIRKYIDGNANRYAVIINNDGKLMLSSNSNIYYHLTGQETFMQSARNLNGNGQSLIENASLPSFKSALIGVSLSIPKYNWIVVSFQSQDNIFAPLITIQKYLWVILLLSLIFSFSFITFFLRKIKIIY